MKRYLVSLIASNDPSLTAEMIVNCEDSLAFEEVAEFALDQEFELGANWSNGERYPDTDGVSAWAVLADEQP